ncbi:MAG: NADPH-dependent F420 reductase [Candidatus Nanopelagicales bacterium]
MSAETTVGIIGAGHIGGQLARLAVAHGYRVVIANARGPQSLAALVAELGDAARAGTAFEAAQAGDLVVVTIPLKNVPALSPQVRAALAGKTVIDTCNYYPQRDGQIAQLDAEATTTSQWVSGHLPGANLVKAFNHIAAQSLTTEAGPAGEPERRALAVFGDDDAARSQVSALIETFGFDALDAGSLAESWRIQRDMPGYVTRLTRTQLSSALAQAVRPLGG